MVIYVTLSSFFRVRIWQYYIILLACLGCKNSNLDSNKMVELERMLNHISNYDIARVNSTLDSIPSSFTKDLFEVELNYILTGNTSEDFFGTVPPKFETKEGEIFYNYSFGDFLFRKSEPIDTLSFKYYAKAYSIAKEENQDELTIETLKRINNYFKKYNLGLNDGNKSIHKYQKYQKELKELAKDSVDVFWAKYYDIHLKMLKVFNKDLTTSSLTTQDFETALSLSPDEPYFQAIIYQLQGIYYTLLLENPIKGAESNKFAEEYYLKSNVFPAKRALFGLNLNNAIADAKKGNDEGAIHKFKVNLRLVPNEKSYHFERQFSYEHLTNTFTKLNELDSVKYYKNLTKKYQDSIKSELLVLGIHEIDKRHNVSRLQKLVGEFNRHKLIYGIIIIIILLLALYSLYRWVKVDKINRLLNVEKKLTYEELAKVKQLVIKDSITLKNKTKVQLDELIFIKSDDHYLELYTSSGKKEYVRGKIKNILDQLPPNFKQCHRSYIVNYNKIRNTTHNKILLENNQFIPLSRTFKSNF